MSQRIFIQNSGALANGTATDPDGVAAGKIAVFNVATGAEHSFEDAAAPAEFVIVQGHATTPIISGIIKAADLVSANYTAYSAPAKKLITVTSVPAGPTGGDNYGVKVVNFKSDSEPFARRTYDVVVPASQLDEDSIYALVARNKTDPNRFVNFGCNKIDTKTVTGASGTLLLTVTDGARTKIYSTAFDTSVAVTIDNVVSVHGADILAVFGITVSDGTTTAIFTGGPKSGDFTVVDTGSTTMAASISVTEATELQIEAVLLEDNFQVFLEDTTGTGIQAATITVTQAFAEGSGSGAQVLLEEQSAGGVFGNYYRDTAYPLNPEYFADVATPGTYDRYDVLVKGSQDGQIPVKGNEYFTLTIAHKVAVTGTMNTFFGI